MLVMDYGNQWRTFRKLVHQYLTEAMVENEHLPIVNAEAVQLVRDYLLYPKNHMLHAKRFSNSISNSISKYTSFLAIKPPRVPLISSFAKSSASVRPAQRANT